MRFNLLFTCLVSSFLVTQCAEADPYAKYKNDNSGYGKRDADDVEDLNFDYARALSADMKYSNGNVMADNTGMQSFDVLASGDVIMAGIGSNKKTYFQRIKPGKASDSYMVVDAGSHCMNMSVEESGSSAYVWFSNMGTAAGGYYDERIISRELFQSGKNIEGKNCTDNYYVGDFTGLYSCVDADNDQIAIIVGLKVRVYKLSDAKNAVVVEKNIGGLTMKVHDLTTIEPKAFFTIDQNTPIQGIDRDGDTRPFQGFGLYKDKLYWLAGDGTNPDAAVSEIDFSGKVVKSCKQLSIDDDTDDLVKMGISQTGYFEPEGIKIRKGKLYIGFIWNLKGVSPWTWRSTILKFN